MAGKGRGQDDPQVKPSPPAQAGPRKPPGEHTTGRFFLPSSAPRYARRQGRMRREGNVPSSWLGSGKGIGFYPKRLPGAGGLLHHNPSLAQAQPAPCRAPKPKPKSKPKPKPKPQGCFSMCHPKARTDGRSPAPPQNGLKQRPHPLFHGIHCAQRTWKINSSARKPRHKRSKGFNAPRGLGTQRSCTPFGALGTARGARSPPQPAARRSPAEVRLSLFLHYLQFVHRRH